MAGVIGLVPGALFEPKVRLICLIDFGGSGGGSFGTGLAGGSVALLDFSEACGTCCCCSTGDLGDSFADLEENKENGLDFFGVGVIDVVFGAGDDCVRRCGRMERALIRSLYTDDSSCGFGS